MKNFKIYFLGILSVFAFVIACTDLEEELVNDFTENLTIPGVTLDALVRAINQVGAGPGDVMAILEALDQAGALRGNLIII